MCWKPTRTSKKKEECPEKTKPRRLPPGLSNEIYAVLIPYNNFLGRVAGSVADTHHVYPRIEVKRVLVHGHHFLTRSLIFFGDDLDLASQDIDHGDGDVLVGAQGVSDVDQVASLHRIRIH